ncbi:hypothetical protein NicSoilE8_30370 [Arthrobacter sp. NicSoilE8]|nr:hypothetical protein NicSoilE8_30370 [Arthrobacter sp. NicSoilE8]
MTDHAPVVAASRRSPYKGKPARTYWIKSVHGQTIDQIPDLYVKKFDISPKWNIATAGSCFAQHIARHLRKNGYTVLDTEPMPPGVDVEEARKLQYGVYSARFGNIYYVRQLLQLAREAIQGVTPGEVVWERDGRFFDALRPSVNPNGFDSAELVLAHRKFHLDAVRRLLHSADVFVFTMGLTEGWELLSDGTVFPTAPGTLAGDFDPSKYGFRNFSYAEIVQDFMEFRSLLKQLRPEVKFILTVSPVPLAATATDEHVLTATTYSKAILRAAAGDIARSCEDVDYFPSFEIITANYIPNSSFNESAREVKDDAVGRVMSYFFSQHPVAVASKSGEQPEESAEQLFCEDALLEVFAR